MCLDERHRFHIMKKFGASKNLFSTWKPASPTNWQQKIHTYRQSKTDLLVRTWQVIIGPATWWNSHKNIHLIGPSCPQPSKYLVSSSMFMFIARYITTHPLPHPPASPTSIDHRSFLTDTLTAMDYKHDPYEVGICASEPGTTTIL
jgi:hypothetical protein